MENKHTPPAGPAYVSPYALPPSSTSRTLQQPGKSSFAIMAAYASQLSRLPPSPSSWTSSNPSTLSPKYDLLRKSGIEIPQTSSAHRQPEKPVPRYARLQTSGPYYNLEGRSESFPARSAFQETSNLVKKGRGKRARSSSTSKPLPLLVDSSSLDNLESVYPPVPSPLPGQPGYKFPPYEPELSGPGNDQGRDDGPHKGNRNRKRKRTDGNFKSVPNTEDPIAEVLSVSNPKQMTTVDAINEKSRQSANVAAQVELLTAELEALEMDEEAWRTGRVMDIEAEIERLQKRFEELVEERNTLEDAVNAKVRDDVEKDTERRMLGRRR